MTDAELYNEDELNAPEWMDLKFFEKILRETEKDNSLKVSSTGKKTNVNSRRFQNFRFKM